MCIETSISLGSLQEFDGASGEFKAPSTPNMNVQYIKKDKHFKKIIQFLHLYIYAKMSKCISLRRLVVFHSNHFCIYCISILFIFSVAVRLCHAMNITHGSYLFFIALIFLLIVLSHLFYIACPLRHCMLAVAFSYSWALLVATLNVPRELVRSEAVIDYRTSQYIKVLELADVPLQR